MSYRFVCDHCGKKFELEAPEAKECPSCFWTSSVKREDELLAEKKTAAGASRVSGSSPFPQALAQGLKILLRAFLFLSILGAAGFLGFKAYKAFAPSSSKGWKSFSIKPSKDEIKTPKRTADPLTLLSPQEKEALFREVTMPPDREPDEGEKIILQRSVTLQTGWRENVPSPVWTLEQYQKMITDQETRYRMPFARSYKKKLEELFQTQYLAAADAFAKGDVLAARDHWVASLAIPLYSTDLKKHRAVALTMLRPYINDTLSKISAMNQSLVDQKKKAREQALGLEYQKLSGLIARKDWPGALAVIGQMTPEVDQLRKNAVPVEAPPPYPASFGSVDLDLQRPLMELMSPSPSTTADLQPLQQDLVEKKQVIETFTADYLEKATAAYRSALGLIREGKWPEAAKALEAVPGPQVLQQDAAEKAAILQKITQSSTS